MSLKVCVCACLRVYVCVCLFVSCFFLVVGGYQLGALTINGRFVWYSTEVKAHTV